MFITDFDGVLCDSVIECLLVTYNAYGKLRTPGYQRLLDIEQIDPQKRETFRQLRSYLKGAEDFVPLYMTMEEGVTIHNQQDFDIFRDAHSDQLPACTAAFYEERDYLKTHERELWLSLNPFFGNFAEELRQHESFENMRILTTKRQDDAAAIFDYQNIPFPRDHIIYMKAAGKSQKLLELLQKHGAEQAASVYFEDQVDFLVESQKHGIGSYLVEWGYVSAEQKALAQQYSIPIITMQQYAEFLRKF
ncbi:hypothetical protein CSA56_11535 [candidate division KSB3 bacterium]|uniref:Haloacid dehalogenase n=1 Tax=candidate division KSB3 bacterium TaxID=2044937 RepID=A0A2G6KEQ3_9BACT|nr:MAG: hypothetical protein CSA56_11535 [candidate division KSB3 bacterium]